MLQWWTGALVVMLAAGLGYYIRLIIGRYEIKSGSLEAKRLLADARRESEALRKEAGLQAKTEVLQALSS